MKANLGAATVYGEGKYDTLSEAVEAEYKKKFRKLFYEEMSQKHRSGSFVSAAMDRPQEFLDLVTFLLSNDLFTRFRDVFHGLREGGGSAEFVQGYWEEYCYTLMHLMANVEEFGECVQDYMTDKHEAAEHDGRELPEEPAQSESSGRAISV